MTKKTTRKIGSWKKARRVLPRLAAAYKTAQVSAIRQEAEFFRKKVLQAFKTGGKSSGVTWAPNKPMVAKMKGSTKPLIHKGDLMGSVTVKQVGPSSFFAGVPNNARSKSGKGLVQIGKVHEFGKVIVMTVTKKQFRFVMALIAKFGGNSGSKRSTKGGFRPGAIMTIKIPERSFLRSTKEAHFKPEKSRKRIMGRVASQMRVITTGTLRTVQK